MMTEDQLLKLVGQDAWRMTILNTVRTLDLPDWWVCAGFVRSAIWDKVHGYADRTPLPDVDVVYYDPNQLDERFEKEYEARLRAMAPEIPWSVKNEARMHLLHEGSPPYLSTVDAIAKFPETATALGLSIDTNGRLELTAPWGIKDAFNCVVRPTPSFEDDPARMILFEERVRKKNWTAIWPLVQLFSFL